MSHSPSHPSSRLLRWYDSRRRDLPWRRRPTPYRVWISEIMLQQTRVEMVVPYFERFIDRFPDVEALAAARLDDVLSLWSGLGYYRRARSLHAAARAIVSRHGGRFPDELDAALALPGIGPYTAAAVLSIAYGKRHGVLDGNVERVMARHLAIDDDPSRAATKRRLREAVQDWLPDDRPGDLNQALMELGATVCRGATPPCERCPIRSDCAARSTGEPGLFPRKKRPGRLQEVRLAALVIERRGRVLLHRPPVEGGTEPERGPPDAPPYLRGLWNFPVVELQSRQSAPEPLERWVTERSGHRAVASAKMGELRHAITFRRITLEVWRGELESSEPRTPRRPPGWRWQLPSQFGKRIAVPSLALKVWKLVEDSRPVQGRGATPRDEPPIRRREDTGRRSTFASPSRCYTSSPSAGSRGNPPPSLLLLDRDRSMARAKKTTGKKRGAGARTARKTAKKKTVRKKKAARKKKTTGKKSPRSSAKKAAKKTPGGKRSGRATAGKTKKKRAAKKTAGSATKKAARKVKKTTSRTATRKSTTAASRADTRRRGVSGRRGAGEDSSSWRTIKAGIDLGNYRTIVMASKNGEVVPLRRNAFPTVVGYLKLGAQLDGVGDDVDVLFDDEAFEHYHEVNFKRPVESGIVTDVKTCRAFAAHISACINPAGRDRLWGVVSAPCHAGTEEQRRVQRSLQDVLERCVVAPEPHLVAEGMQLEGSVRQLGVVGDLGSCSLVIDIGASHTSLCLVHENWKELEHIELHKGGHWVDRKILSAATFLCSGLSLTPRLAVKIKEEQAFASSQPMHSSPGGSELIALTEVIRSACDELLGEIVASTCTLLESCDPGLARTYARNIVVTGGGSRIRGLAAALEEKLRSRGHDAVRVLIPGNYKRLVAQGALRYAEKLSEKGWEVLAERRWRSQPMSRPAVAPCAPATDASEEPRLSTLWDFQPQLPLDDPAPEPEPGFLLERQPGLSELDELELYKALQPAE